MTIAAPEDWRELQSSVARVLADAGFTVQIEQKMTTARGSVEFDVFAEININGHRHSVVCECKYWRSNVPQTVVHAFRTVVDDLGADAGYIVSSAGFQSGAYEATKNTSIRLVTWDEFLSVFAPDGPPLGPGLRATARIVNGQIKYHDGQGQPLPWGQSLITAGTIGRDASGRVVAFVETQAPLPGMQAANERIGFRGFELQSVDQVVSTSEAAPTVLKGQMAFTLPQGTQGINPMSGGILTIPVDVSLRMDIEVRGHLSGNTFAGAWIAVGHFGPQSFPVKGAFSSVVF